MKKRFWRTLAAGLAAVLVLACCAACQGDDALPAAQGWSQSWARWRTIGMTTGAWATTAPPIGR